ncbi:MAG: hypothetical protein P1U38_09535 [Aeromicrobium sp.]|uniref:hypothetical protein n=1 Tax=Aeromicrobium sp. TaxID=1871063 RepID=UPI00262B4165|nr:hypothetical protein [Aeromicrobium sp.]MDF1705002.1 hypothetical protein [Aeromicrobium sp.]
MNRLRLTAWLLTALTVALSMASIFIILGGVSDRLDEAERRSDSNASAASSANAEAAEAQAQAAALAEQVESLGQVPVVEPDDTITTPTTTSPSFSFIQRLIDLGISARCPGGSCVGPEGAPAPPAEDGSDGQDGRNGADGQTPSTELLLSLIQPLIPAPIPGVNAPRVTSVACSSLTIVDLTFAFDDGTVLTASCGPAIEPEQPVDPPLEPAA